MYAEPVNEMEHLCGGDERCELAEAQSKTQRRM